MPWMEMLAMADAGIHVVWCNPRGSSGYGDAFASAITGAWGEKDTSDLLAVIDHLIRAGRAERSRVGVVGLSYGGFMVHWLLGHAPGRFAAGVSENPVTDLAAEFGAADFGVDIGASGAGTAAPFDEPERWHRRSPASQIHRNEVPLLLLQCESDMRCPAVNSEIPFAILKSLGRPVEMVRYPDEFHSLLNSGRPDRRVDRLERIVGWFKTHL
jgi:dipeptidyl aminopeptidase/acylaminoacyl peptidase